MNETLIGDGPVSEPETPVGDGAPETVLTLSAEAAAHLSTTRKWTLFLSVMGFIASGFLLLMGIAMLFVLGFRDASARTEELPIGWIVPFYFVLAVVYFVGTLYLFRFSANARTALASNDADALTAAFRSLKVHYAIIGMSIIGGFVLYAALIIGIIGFGLTQQRTPFSGAYDLKRPLHPKYANMYVDSSDHTVLYDSTILHPSVIQTEMTGSRVFFDGAAISITDAKGAGAVLEMVGYFDAAHPDLDAFFYKEKDTYVISFGVNESAFEDEEVAKALKKGLAELHKTYGKRVYRFKLLAMDAQGKRREKLVGEN